MSEAAETRTPARAIAGPSAKASGTREQKPSPVAWTARILDASIVIAFLALTFLFGAFPNKDTDFWWHLRTGDWIRENGQVPTTDLYTFGAEGHAWVDLHWMFQVLLSYGYQQGGTVGLNLAKCVVTTLGVGLLAFAARRRNWPIWAMALAWLPGLFVLSGRMYIRPETLTFLYLAATLAVVFHWDRRPWLALALPVIQLAWVNSQGLFILGPAVIAMGLIEAATRRGAFAKDRSRWWTMVGGSVIGAGLACLANPYGLRGAFYPFELLSTMRNPIFSRSIAELMPLADFIRSTGFNNLPVRIHFGALILCGLSFVVPLFWRLAVEGFTRRDGSGAGWLTTKPKGKSRKKGGSRTVPLWRLSTFRLLLFATFGYLSLLATRNSHQFGAVAGTITAWNIGEWAAAIRRHREERSRRGPKTDRPPVIGRAITLAAILSALGLVASGQFYAWTGEKRTIGLGEEPLWFPHEATRFCGTEGMPDRQISFHNGHAALYEYYFGGTRKTYADARLEVMGPELYAEYLNLERAIGSDAEGWAARLDHFGNPAILVDNLHDTVSTIAATMLNDRRYRCVWYDPIASVYVHEKYAEVVAKHAIDFAGLHFSGESGVASAPIDVDREAAMARSLAKHASMLAIRGGGGELVRGIAMVGLDHARRVRQASPDSLDGWKQAAMLEFSREPGILAEGPVVPRFRLEFDPVFDLAATRAIAYFRRGLELAPDDVRCLHSLPILYRSRGMNAEALALIERFLRLPGTNESLRLGQRRALVDAARLRQELGAEPSLSWKNESELETTVSKLLAAGRAARAAELLERAYRPEVRTWATTDRIATIRLNLGEPGVARTALLAAALGTAPPGVRESRIGYSFLIEDDFDAARRSFEQARAAAPGLFEAAYGLAATELDAGRAAACLAAAQAAETIATRPTDRSSAHAIAVTAVPYADAGRRASR